MPFVDEILKYSSLSIVGLEKNTGKTESLNYILNRVKVSNKQIALTSIGIDGEGLDLVTHTLKPEIEVFENMLFVTSEKHYKAKQLTAEVIDISKKRTSLGRLVTAKARTSGKVLLSGPAYTGWLVELIEELKSKSADLTIVDGALSRLSLASPAVTQAMVLATGAALSANIPELVKKTAFMHTLIKLPEASAEIKSKLASVEHGVWAIDGNGSLQNLHIKSALSISENNTNLLAHGTTIFVAGALSDKLINFLRIQKQIQEVKVVIRDFSKAFISPEAYNAFMRKGGEIQVLQSTKLVAVTVNPFAPNGQRLNSQELVHAMREALQIPVYDIKKIE